MSDEKEQASETPDSGASVLSAGLETQQKRRRCKPKKARRADMHVETTITFTTSASVDERDEREAILAAMAHAKTRTPGKTP